MEKSTISLKEYFKYLIRGNLKLKAPVAVKNFKLQGIFKLQIYFVLLNNNSFDSDFSYKSNVFICCVDPETRKFD